MRAPRILTFLFLLLAPALAGCDDPSGSKDPERVPEDQLVFARADEDAPPLDALEVSFWAKPGETRSAAIRYVGVKDERYALCMEFKVPAGSLLRHPDGRAVQPGDSVRVTVTVLDPDRFIFHFAPAGLRFDPANPALLRVTTWWADRDFDEDGDHDKEDERLEQRAALWRQERPGEPWTRMPTTRVEDVPEVMTKVSGFTRYAFATN